MMTVHSDGDLDALVVEDALAFIDAFYASSDPTPYNIDEESPCETVQNGTPLYDLGAAVEDLYSKLKGFNGRLRIAPANGSHLSLELHEIQRRLDACLPRLWQYLRQRQWTLRLVPLEDATVSLFLQRRLDEIIARVTSGHCERPLLERRASMEFVSDQYSHNSQKGVTVRFRSGRFIPFKLSVLSKAAWSVVVDSSFRATGHPQAAAFEYKDELVSPFQEELDGSDGVIVLRRVHLPDGSLLFCWTAVTTSTAAHPDESMNPVKLSAEIHQFGWVRVGRLYPDAGHTPRVYLESSDSFKSTVTTLFGVDDVTNQQLLENRMLDATRQGPGLPRIPQR